MLPVCGSLKGGIKSAACSWSKVQLLLHSHVRITIRTARVMALLLPVCLIFAASRSDGDDLFWRGMVNSTWDNSSATNWFNPIGMSNGPFMRFDNVTFDDTGTGNPIKIAAAVEPRSVTVSGTSGNYTFSGSGSIVGPTGLTVTNNGTLTVDTTNSYSGVTALNGGIVSVGQLAIGGNPSALGAANSAPANLFFNGGQLQYSGPSVSIDRGVTLGGNGGTIAVTSPDATLTMIGPIVGTRGGGLTVSGCGTFALSGANTYNGVTTVGSQAALELLGGTFGGGDIVNNGTLFLGVTIAIPNNISGTGLLTNTPGCELTLSGSNTFSGNLDAGGGKVFVASSGALPDNIQVTLFGPYPTIALSPGVSTPKNTTLVMMMSGMKNDRAEIIPNAAGGGIWNGPISLIGNGTANQQMQFTGTRNPAAPLVINGNTTASLTNGFYGQVQIRGPHEFGIINGTLTLNSNVDLELNDGSIWIIKSAGNTWGYDDFPNGVLILGANNALPPSAPLSLGGAGTIGLVDLAGHSQQIEGLTNSASGSGAAIITNSSSTFGTLIYSNTGYYAFHNATSMPHNFAGYFTNFNGVIAGNLALDVAAGTLALGSSNIYTYTGTTIISNATLVLNGNGSIAHSANIVIGTNATLDVSHLSSPFTLGSTQTLTGAGATGTIAGNLDLATGSLVLNSTTDTPTLTVTNGILTFDGDNTVAVTVKASGSLAMQRPYVLISATNGGFIAGTPPASVTVNGLTNTPGTYGAYLTISGGQLCLDISQNPVVLNEYPVTYTNPFTLYKGANPTFSISGVGGASPFTYQWFSNDVAMSGAATTNLALTNVQTSFTNYYCVVKNMYGSATSFVWSASVIADPTNADGGLASYPSNVLALNPIGYWRMNEPDDRKNDGNPGVITHDYAGGNDALYTNVNLGVPGYNPDQDPSDASAMFGTYAGVRGSANSICGIDVSAPNGVNGEFTVGAWVAAASQGNANCGIVTKGYSGQEEFVIDSGAPGNCFRFVTRNAAGTDYSADSTMNSYGNGDWHYLVGVCDETNHSLSFYIDGILATNVDIPANSGVFNSSATPMTIGARATSAISGITNEFYGGIKDVAVFNYALTPSQVAAAYQLGWYPTNN